MPAGGAALNQILNLHQHYFEKINFLANIL